MEQSPREHTGSFKATRLFLEKGKDGSFPESDRKEDMVEIQRHVAMGVSKVEGP